MSSTRTATRKFLLMYCILNSVLCTLMYFDLKMHCKYILRSVGTSAVWIDPHTSVYHDYSRRRWWQTLQYNAVVVRSAEAAEASKKCRGVVQTSHVGGTSPLHSCSLPFPFPSPPFPSPSFPSSPLPSAPLLPSPPSLSIPLEVGPLIAARESGGTL